MMDVITALIQAFAPDVVFSISFFIGFIGFGVFMARSVWPWAMGYLDRRLDYEFQLSKQRWEVIRYLSEDIKEIQRLLAKFEELERQSLENQRLILDRLTRPEKTIDT